jgi:hydrogenase maturation protease
MSPDRPLLVLGLGNLLCGDDGLGVAAVDALARRYEAPEGVRILDGGTLGLSLLPYLQDAGQVVLVDAIRADGPPGSPVRLEGDEVAPAVEARLSVHQIGVADLLDGARWLGAYPSRLVLLGLVPETIELGLGLSPAVRAGLPGLVERVAMEVREMGFRLSPRASHDEAVGPSARLLADLCPRPA